MKFVWKLLGSFSEAVICRDILKRGTQTDQESCYQFCLRFAMYQTIDIGSIIALNLLFSYLYLLGNNTIADFLQDRFWVVFCFNCIELILELFVTFLVPLLLPRLRPEYKQFSFVKICLDHMHKEINKHHRIYLLVSFMVFFALEKYGFNLVAMHDVY